MMRRMALAAVLVLTAFTVVFVAPTTFAKGSPDAIVISGGGLKRPIEITDAETLKRFDPWSARFVDWARQAAPRRQNASSSYQGLDPQGLWTTVEAPHQADHRADPYQVFIYMKWPGRHSPYDRGNLAMVYEFLYSPGNDASGYVYLPGEKDAWNQTNRGTIIREGHDGRWHFASAAWDEAMRLAVTSQ